ncbi:putative WD repeat-containing protein 87 [Apostichopus japonicus]|uniref:Putative WD repeat-containing protein 87 n=1 Tax=Stichopus japonicus TaxID=307972 RepID=A0A2G8KFQ3_STIJA|nr:putative WD repeat-containing protein 87 [Apostichopus japonicus]
MTHTVAKLLPWSSVKGHVEVLLKKLDPEDVMVMVPYGLQLVHSFRHPHVLRCMSFYHSTKGNTFVTHIDSGASLIMYTWTISSLDEVKVECQKFRIYTAINHLLSVPQHRVFIGFCSDMSLRVFTDVLHKCSELSKTEIPTSVLW